MYKRQIYIIDLQKSVGKVDEAYKAVSDIAAEGGTILFVGTKKQAQDAIKTEAERCGMFYVNAVSYTHLADGTKGIVSLAGKKPVYVIAQDAASCVVYGMPKAVAEAGVVDEVVPLNDVAKSIIKNVGVK